MWVEYFSFQLLICTRPYPIPLAKRAIVSTSVLYIWVMYGPGQVHPMSTQLVREQPCGTIYEGQISLMSRTKRSLCMTMMRSRNQSMHAKSGLRLLHMMSATSPDKEQLKNGNGRET